jgi:hypothetical protein
MMGSRGNRGGDECDAFGRRSRRIVHWKQGELRAIKRRYWKRVRKMARSDLIEANLAHDKISRLTIDPIN